MDHSENVKQPLGRWLGSPASLTTTSEDMQHYLLRLDQPLFVVAKPDGAIAATTSGRADLGAGGPDDTAALPMIGYTPPLRPEDLGDEGFKRQYGLKYAYIAGAMANGITSVEMVAAAGRAGLLGFFGSAGLDLTTVESALDRLQSMPGHIPFGSNLIHSPNEPDLEQGIVDLYLRKGISLVSASAYLRMTLPIVQYRVTGIHRDTAGRIVCPNRIFAKVSRVEVAEKFFSPPPAKLLGQLVSQGKIPATEADLAAHIPMAEVMTAEADSGGHTDNRPALALFPTIVALKNRLAAKYGYDQPLFAGLGGGIATPESTAAAFAMGAAYVLTGSINQACVEAGTSEVVRQMLCEAGQADVVMAPAADMFEMGVKVQVLKRGTMFAVRAAKLYDYYRSYNSYAEIPENQRTVLERDFFRGSFDQEWQQTRAFFEQRDPSQIERAARDPRHKMALVFRSYLGRSSKWSVTGQADRQLDFQIWCGPAMGAFNEWVKGSFLAEKENRETATVALNLLYGACVVTRAASLRNQGISLPPGTESFSPQPLENLKGM
ncbi:MAG: Enoyl-[acyl-carrier-protein] reductase [FMN] (EC 1.3.1.9), inferred for PFA pathway [Olavius algarvensis Delta 4 endosymbiont]|nr:MAG: Enoyl-[acyl-carrier-protein] reductase [FMN] (EC 1.3.1.9), inferred for PFA pathway [Olavius algarvensis Delta 4 endosymbiont]